jgi:hypothetical protein
MQATSPRANSRSILRAQHAATITSTTGARGEGRAPVPP